MIKGCYPSINTMFCLLTTRRFLLFLPQFRNSFHPVLRIKLFFHLRHLILDKLLIESQCLRFLVFLSTLVFLTVVLPFLALLITLFISVSKSSSSVISIFLMMVITFLNICSLVRVVICMINTLLTSLHFFK